MATIILFLCASVLSRSKMHLIRMASFVAPITQPESLSAADLISMLCTACSNTHTLMLGGSTGGVEHSQSTVGERQTAHASLDDLGRVCILQLDAPVKGF